MIALDTLSEGIPLPPTPQGWFDHGYTALADSRLALIRTCRDVHAEYGRWLKAASAGGPRPAYPSLWDGDLRLSVFDGGAETDVAMVASIAHPFVDRMPDGRWLVAGSRADPGEKNARIHAADGLVEYRMMLGDGIASLLCSPDGTIWVGYFDEGVFGARNKDGSWPVSTGGIVQFDAAGTPLWSFNAQVDSDRMVDDAYAMTLSGTDLWACYYTDFPIARVRGGKPAFWSNRVSGATAIAVKDDLVLLGGGYGADAKRITLVKLDGGSSRELGRIATGPGKGGGATLLQGRGSAMHVVSDGMWYRLKAHQAEAAIRGERRA
jgi:hypothetical protein